MKIKVGQLKTHLSRYLRELEAGGEPIQVCVREEPVAYLVSVRHQSSEGRPGSRELQSKLERVGLIWNGEGELSEFHPVPSLAEDGKKDVASIPAIRSQRGW